MLPATQEELLRRLGGDTEENRHILLIYAAFTEEAHHQIRRVHMATGQYLQRDQLEILVDRDMYHFIHCLPPSLLDIKYPDVPGEFPKRLYQGVEIVLSPELPVAYSVQARRDFARHMSTGMSLAFSDLRAPYAHMSADHRRLAARILDIPEDKA